MMRAMTSDRRRVGGLWSGPPRRSDHVDSHEFLGSDQKVVGLVGFWGRRPELGWPVLTQPRTTISLSESDQPDHGQVQRADWYGRPIELEMFLIPFSRRRTHGDLV